MAVTTQDVQKYLAAMELKFYCDPITGSAMVPMGGSNGKFLITIQIQLSGTFLQFRTIQLLTCTAESPNIVPFLKTLAALNYQRRFIKMGWDPSDGDLVAYGDIWVCDQELSQEQFQRSFGNFFTALDSNMEAVNKAINSGADFRMESSSGALQSLMEQLRARLPKEELEKFLKALAEKESKPVVDEV